MTAHEANGPKPAMVIHFQDVRVERDGRQVFVGERALHLTGTEFRLLEQLLLHPGRTFTRDELMKAVIAGEAIVLERTIDKHVQALRAKLGWHDWIETVRKTGYRLRLPKPPES